MLYLYLAAGGAVGTLSRFWLTARIHETAGFWFPWGTLTVNLLGSLVLGVAMGAAEQAAISPEVRAMITVGLCGAFTTFSTMSYETAILVQDGAWSRAAVYALGGLALGLAAVVIGLQAGRLVGA